MPDRSTRLVDALWEIYHHAYDPETSREDLEADFDRMRDIAYKALHKDSSLGYTCAVCNPDEPHPDVDYCDNCPTSTNATIESAIQKRLFNGATDGATLLAFVQAQGDWSTKQVWSVAERLVEAETVHFNVEEDEWSIRGGAT